MEAVLAEVAKASPFGVMCILFVWLQHKTHNKHTTELKETYDQSIKELKELYEKVYEKLDKRAKASATR